MSISDQLTFLLRWCFSNWCTWMEMRGSFRAIHREGADLYLDRYFLLKFRGCALFLHRFHESDPDYMHDHPWPWGRLLLSGGYWEHYHDGKSTWMEPGNMVFHRSPHVLHRVEITKDLEGKVWTLFWHWPRVRLWGFFEEDGTWQSALSLGDQEQRKTEGYIFPRFKS